MVTKDEFIERLSRKGYTKRDAGVIMDDFIKTLEEALVDGESVMFHGFGSFEIRERAERKSKGLNSEDIVIPSYKTAHFTPGKRLRREIKEGLIRE